MSTIKEDNITSEVCNLPHVNAYDKMFETIPTVSMKVFSWWKQNKS